MPNSQPLRLLREPRLVLLSLTFFLFAGTGETAVAKQWPVQQSPTEAPVPQYVPGTTGRVGSTAPRSTRPAAKPVDQLPDFFDRSSSQPSIPGDQLLAPNPLAKSNPRQQRPSTPQPQPVPVPSPPTPGALPGALPSPQSVIQPAIPLSTAPKSNRSNKKKVDQNKAPEKHKPLLDETIYRDYSSFPIDPRKPCSQCTQGRGACTCGIGNHGRPYQEKLYGGCRCDSCRSTKHPDFSVHWPRPFSAKLDQRHPEWEAARHSGCPEKRIVDVFDSLSTFKLLKYKRTDNGYCGPGSDPYGCLGESKLRAAAIESVGQHTVTR